MNAIWRECDQCDSESKAYYPLNVIPCLPLIPSQSQTVFSRDPEAIRVLSAEYPNDAMPPECLLSTFKCAPLAAFHS